MAEAILFVAVFALPLIAGAAARMLGKPWWWGALAALAIMLVAAIAPEPEKGESRVAAGDLVFLLVVALIVTALAWLGAWIAGRFAGPTGDSRRV